MKGDYDITVHFERSFTLYELGELAAIQLKPLTYKKINLT